MELKSNFWGSGLYLNNQKITVNEAKEKAEQLAKEWEAFGLYSLKFIENNLDRKSSTIFMKRKKEIFFQ